MYIYVNNEVNEHYTIMRGLILFLSATAIKINKKGKIFNRIQFRKQLEENYQNLYINYFIYRKLFPYTDIAQRCYITELDKRCTKFLLQNVMYKFYIVCLLGPNAVLVFYISIESCTDSFSISQGSIFFAGVEWVGCCYRWFSLELQWFEYECYIFDNFVKLKLFRWALGGISYKVNRPVYIKIKGLGLKNSNSTPVSSHRLALLPSIHWQTLPNIFTD